MKIKFYIYNEEDKEFENPLTLVLQRQAAEVDNIQINLNMEIKEILHSHLNHDFFSLLERVSIECRKTKTKIITLANQKEQRQSSKPIKTRSNHAQATQSAGKCARASHDWFWFHF